MTGKLPTRVEVKVAKNYLSEEELHFLENISEQFLLFCESQAMRGKRMSMEELTTRLNTLLMANDYPVLYEYGTALRKKADTHAVNQLTKFKMLPVRRRKELS
jgi:hypothetical protein